MVEEMKEQNKKIKPHMLLCR